MLRRFAFLVALAALILPLIAPGQPPAAQGRKGQPARLDRYGDPLPPRAIARLGSVRFRVPAEVNALAVSPDGRLVAVGDGLGGSAVTVWDAVSGKQVHCLQGHHGSFLCVAFSADSKLLASGGDQSICL